MRSKRGSLTHADMDDTSTLMGASSAVVIVAGVALGAVLLGAAYFLIQNLL